MPFPTLINAISGTVLANDDPWSISLSGLTLVAGDRLLLKLGIDGSQTGSASGWNNIGRAASTTVITGEVHTRVSDGAETAISVDLSAAGEHGSWRVQQWRNAGTPTATGTSGSSTNADPPSHTAAASEDHTFVAACMHDATVVATVAPSGYGNLQTVGGADSSGATISTAELQVAATQTQNPGAFTSATEQWVAFTIDIPYSAPVSGNPWNAYRQQ